MEETTNHNKSLHVHWCKSPENANLDRRKKTTRYLGLRLGLQRGKKCSEYRFLLGMIKCSKIRRCWRLYNFWEYTSNHWIVPSKWVGFMVHELYLNKFYCFLKSNWKTSKESRFFFCHKHPRPISSCGRRKPILPLLTHSEVTLCLPPRTGVDRRPGAHQENQQTKSHFFSWFLHWYFPYFFSSGPDTSLFIFISST